MYADLEGKVVLITGAGQGIGKETAHLFATNHCHLVITDIDGVTLNATAEEIREQCPNVTVLTFLGDISKQDDNKNVVKIAIDTFGHLDILVNNAGIGRQNNIWSDNLMTDFDFQMMINVKGMLSLIQSSIPYLIQSKGCIINISSIASFVSMENVLIHCMTKSVVTSLTQCLAADLARVGVRVNEVAPAFTKTEMWSAIKWTPEQIKVIFDNATREMPLGKVCESRDISQAILKLASNGQSHFITGHTLAVDGGLLSRGKINV